MCLRKRDLGRPSPSSQPKVFRTRGSTTSKNEFTIFINERLSFQNLCCLPSGKYLRHSVCHFPPPPLPGSDCSFSQNLQDTLRQMAPRQTLSGSISFGGKSRMATPIISLRMERVLIKRTSFIICVLGCQA